MKPSHYRFSIFLLLSLCIFPVYAQTLVYGLEGIYKLSPKAKAPFYLQAGTFQYKNFAFGFKKQFVPFGFDIKIVKKANLYTVIVGPIPTRVQLERLTRPPEPQKVQRSLPAVAPKPLYQIVEIPLLIQPATRHPWSVIGSIGYTNYQNMYLNDGQTAVLRLALGRDLFKVNLWTIGLEGGVQNGNTMRLYAPQSTLDILGELPIQTTVKPLIDLLFTLKAPPFSKTPFIPLFKGGLAARRWQFSDRDSINNLSKIGGEVQAGFAYPINKRINLSVLYQGIFGSNPDFQVNAAAETGHVSDIPIQNGVLLSLSAAF